MQKFIGTIVCLALLPLVIANLTPRQRFEQLKELKTPFLETYWESYTSAAYNYTTCYSHTDPFEVDYSDFGVDLSSVPVAGDQLGVNIVNIAFASPNLDFCRFSQCNPYVCGLHFFQKDGIDSERFEEFKQKISALKSKGAFVKLSLGGQEWGNTVLSIKTTLYAQILVDRIKEAIELLGVDGIDLVQNQGYGTANMNANDESSIQLYIVKLLREQLPNHIISYTFPGDYVTFPFRDVIEYGHQYFDSISVYRANDESMQGFEALGAPRNKLVWGVAIGCNGGMPFPDVSVEKAGEIALKVYSGNYAGAMTWSVNRDTDHRTAVTGECNPEQTGKPDGTYITVMSSILHN